MCIEEHETGARCWSNTQYFCHLLERWRLYFQSKQQDHQDLGGAAQALPRSGNARPQQQQHRGYKGQLIPRAASQEPVSVTIRVSLLIDHTL